MINLEINSKYNPIANKIEILWDHKTQDGTIIFTVYKHFETGEQLFDKTILIKLSEVDQEKSGIVYNILAQLMEEKYLESIAPISTSATEV